MAPALAGVRLGFKVPLRRAETSWEAAPHRLSAAGQQPSPRAARIGTPKLSWANL